MLTKILREPLLHFVMLGGLLFAAWSCKAPQQSDGLGEDVIVLDQARLDHLETLWSAMWKREPAPQDLMAIIDRHLRQEVFYREALRMGLDRDDDIVRTRLAQKMEAITSDLSALVTPPTDDQIRAFYEDRKDLFTIPQAFAFRQVLYLPSEAEDAALEATLASLRQGGAVPESRRNKLSLPLEWGLTPSPELENAFGGGFAETLADLPVGQWAGPMRSGLGLHLVQVIEHQPEHVAPFEDIRDAVLRQYEYYSVLVAQEEMFQELLAKYEIRFEAEDVPPEVLDRYMGQ